MTTYTQISYYRDTQQRLPALQCSQCGGEVFPGEVYYDIGGQAVCRDCLELFARRHFRHCRRQAPWGNAK